jgi:hypothetical protein
MVSDQDLEKKKKRPLIKISKSITSTWKGHPVVCAAGLVFFIFRNFKLDKLEGCFNIQDK